MSQFRKEGCKAFRSGQAVGDNPYFIPGDSVGHRAGEWFAGYATACRGAVTDKAPEPKRCPLCPETCTCSAAMCDSEGGGHD